MTFAVGRVVGSYRIVECIGHGGMATIFRAHQETLDRDVALKVIHPALMNDPSFQERLNREASIVAKLNHPNIVPIYDYGQADGIPYLVMRFVDGKTLQALLKEGRIETGRILEIAHAIGSALAYAHGHDVLHRDVKPSNILIDVEGSIFLSDFGLARLTYAGDSSASRDMLIGSPYYLSPEQAKGESLDGRTDIYSFGIVLFEMFTGSVPFSGDTPYATVLSHINDPLPQAGALNPRMPLAVELVLQKALAKNRVDRYTSVDQMLVALKNAISGPGAKGEPLEGPEDGILAYQFAPALAESSSRDARYNLPRFLERRVRRLKQNLYRRPERSEEGVEESEGQDHEMNAARAPLPEPESADAAAVSDWPEKDAHVEPGAAPKPGGRLLTRLPRLTETWRLVAIAIIILIVFLVLASAPNLYSPSPQASRPLVYLPTLTETASPFRSGGEFSTIDQTKTPSHAPTTPSVIAQDTALRPQQPTRVAAAPSSPGSSLDLAHGKIAYSVALGDLAELHSVWLANANGTGAQKIVDMAIWPALSPDGKRIAYYRLKDSGIYVANADGSKPAKVLGFADSCCVQWSPDSRRLLYFRGNLRYGGTIFSAAADGTDIVEITTGFNPAWSPDGRLIAYANCQTNSSQCGLYVYDLAKKTATMLTRDNGANPQWSPRGDKIVYQADDGHSHVNVFVVNADGTGIKQLTFGQSNDGQPVWSRDASAIYWRSDQNGTGWALYAMRPDGSNARLVLGNIAPDRNLWGRESLSTSP